MLGFVGCTTMRPIAPDFSSPTRFHVSPPSVDLKMPQAAAATKKVRDGLAMPATLETRPIMFAGPMLRQRNPASSVESSVMPPARDAGLCTPVVTVTSLGGGRCGRGSCRARAESVDDGGGCGGGAGGF